MTSPVPFGLLVKRFSPGDSAADVAACWRADRRSLAGDRRNPHGGAVVIRRWTDTAAGTEALDRLNRLCGLSDVRDIITAGNAAYAPIAVRMATAAAAGEESDFMAAVAEAGPFLRQAISLAVERARRRA